MADDACCPDLYWCDGEGNVEAATSRPAPGYSGPWRTAAEAFDNCPPPDVTIACADCGTYYFPKFMTVSFVNKTGSASGLPNSFVLTAGGDLPLGSGCLGAVVPCYGHQADPGAVFGGSCGAAGSGFAMQFQLVDTLTPTSRFLIDPAGTSTLEPGWAVGTIVAPHLGELTYTIGCGDEALALPMFVGTVAIWDAYTNAAGTVDMYLS